ncbi:MAG: HPF/RaiA family ribosome-associated protein [Flavobacterium sp.]|nr:HPF/RaiA family ribosome-associated protein [Flavobacterium sp.]
MHIQMNTDNHVDGYQRVENYFSSMIETALERFDDKITGLDVHLGDENSDKFGTNDKRCMIEARLAGLKPVAVVNHADTIDKAVSGAIDKMKKVLDTTFGKMRTH